MIRRLGASGRVGLQLTVASGEERMTRRPSRGEAQRMQASATTLQSGGDLHATVLTQAMDAPPTDHAVGDRGSAPEMPIVLRTDGIGGLEQ